MKEKTSNFQALGSDGKTYWVDVWTTMLTHNGHKIKGGREYLLANGDELFDVPGVDGQWDIASTNVRITKV